ncbi:hypothetical protein D0863_13760 [Hortaea werneckii]|uniref:Survival Motor Neuron Gemin2-binding domain-containing protein n=1 Tax=Hortaea werneckii TaxID=91943 RepID=A0A3M7CPS0_HORWE|nr:hypothetical protein D0863_13760 [Hortaea werneckii]
MAKQDLSHEEVWDDSDLVKSWNEALAEYKKYHCLTKPKANPKMPAASGVEAPQSHQAQAQAPAAVGGSMMPQALMNSVQDEGLKNMMMSWYYAGYYTGLYEGQQKAYASMQPGA